MRWRPTTSGPPLVLIAVGLVVVVVSVALPASHSLVGSRLTPPGERTITLDPGSWTLYERTGTSPTLTPADVIISGPREVRTRSDPLRGKETRFGAVYTGAVRIEVPQRGSYTIAVSGTTHEVIIGRRVSSGRRRILTGLAGGLALVAGAITLIIWLRGRPSRGTLGR